MVYLFYLLAGSIEGVRILNDVFFLVSVIVMFYLAKEVLGGLLGAFIASGFYGVFMNVPALEGMFALPASMAVPFIVVSFYFGLIYWRKGQRMFLLLTGIFFAVAELIYLRETPFILVVMFMIFKKNLSLKQGVTNIAKDIGFLVVGAFVPLSVLVFYFASRGLVGNLVSGVLTPVHLLLEPRVFPFVWALLTIFESLPLLTFSLGGIRVALSRRAKYDVLLVFMLVLGYALDSVSFFGHYLLNIVVPSALLSAIFVPRFVGVVSRAVKSDRVRLRELFMISVLLLSFPVSIYFQSQRYPTGSIQTGFFFWGVSPLGSYENQTMLANFLRDNTGPGEQVLVHGWMPELYYLSGIQAPSPNLNTYQVGYTISRAEYQLLLDMVIQQKFKYVVLANWANWDTDSIAIAARVHYREIDRFGRAMLYERQNLSQFVKDSSFEDISNWVVADPGCATYTTAYAHSGNGSTIISQSGSILSNPVYQDVPVKGSSEYRLSAWSLNYLRNDFWFGIDETDTDGKLRGTHKTVGRI
jgi:hypothetical protein